MISKLKHFFKPQLAPEAGIFHYLRDEEDGKSRLHLRIDPDGHGILIINANRVVHLNPSATLMAYLHLEGKSPDDAARILRKQFKAPASQMRQDYQAYGLQLEELISPNGGCPVCDMGLETSRPFSVIPTAPYRMDLALTYRCNNDCSHCYNARFNCQSHPDHAGHAEKRWHYCHFCLRWT